MEEVYCVDGEKTKRTQKFDSSPKDLFAFLSFLYFST
jgi:hypothetical protein